MKQLLIIPILLATSLFANAKEITYTIDPTHTATVFSWDHLGFSTPSANFKAINGEITFDDENINNAQVNVVIGVDSINTNIDMFDDKLQGIEWFNVAEFPIITFKSTKVTPLENNQYNIEGNLTIKGITQSINLLAKLNKQGIHPMDNKNAIGFNAITEFNRSDFGISAYVPDVSDKINVEITVEAIEKD